MKLAAAKALRRASAHTASTSNNTSSSSADSSPTGHSPPPSLLPDPRLHPSSQRRKSLFGLRRTPWKPKRNKSDTVPSASASIRTSSNTSPTDHQQHDPPPPDTVTTQHVPSLNVQEASPEKDPKAPSRRAPNSDPKPAVPRSIASSHRQRSSLPQSPLRLEFARPESTSDLDIPPAVPADYFSSVNAAQTITATPMSTRRRVWVKRPGASATLVQFQEDDLVDDVRDTILRKYQNSLGRSFDAPDVSLKITPREASHRERILSPEEPMSKTLEAFFPGGQTVEEALLIDVPVKRTPRASPGLSSGTHHVTYVDYHRPAENGSDYFPPMPAPSPGPVASTDSRPFHPPHSISVIETGQVPALPSPGAGGKARHRPKTARTHTGSPTFINGNGSITSVRTHKARRDSDHQRPPNPPPLPTPPAPDMTSSALAGKVATPPAPMERVASPRPKRRKPKPIGDAGNGGDIRNHYPSLPPGVLDNSVPPINVLIVEDNIINLKLLEQLARKLKIRWQTAMNGREAVQKWRTGGFHLVLMDIQLPIMSGLEATKEIRRLERMNGIAVFARSEAEDQPPQLVVEAIMTNPDDKIDGIFKSPVIIVALTASSLQSDRHEALAAGCNDFLTKPVNTVWFERKVMEWGCMQALIDFDGWRQWKDQAAQEERAKAEKEKNMTEEQRLKKEKKEKKRAEALAKMGMAH